MSPIQRHHDRIVSCCCCCLFYVILQQMNINEKMLKCDTKFKCYFGCFLPFLLREKCLCHSRKIEFYDTSIHHTMITCNFLSLRWYSLSSIKIELTCHPSLMYTFMLYMKKLLILFLYAPKENYPRAQIWQFEAFPWFKWMGVDIQQKLVGCEMKFSALKVFL